MYLRYIGTSMCCYCTIACAYWALKILLIFTMVVVIAAAFLLMLLGVIVLVVDATVNEHMQCTYRPY